MPCVNCYIAWAQDLLPSLTALLIGLYYYFLRPTSHSNSAPTYGSRYLPPFLRGLIAAYEIGKDEDAFLKALRGIGKVVYIPWPIGQYFVTDEEVMKEVYETDKEVLAFVPIRQSIQHTTFGSSLSVSYSSEMPTKLFPLHSKFLSKFNLVPPFERYVKSLRSSLDSLREEIDKSEKGEIDVDLIDWVTETMFEASLVALYGPNLCTLTSSTTPSSSSSTSSPRSNRLHTLFKIFDKSFPLFASEIIPSLFQFLVKPMRDGKKAREEMRDLFMTWLGDDDIVGDGAEGCDDGVILEMIKLGKDVGWSKQEVANVLVADCWALQANAPFCAVWLLLYILQSSSSSHLLSSLLKEYASLTSPLSLSSDLPLTQSCITETLRTATSSFSIRVAQRECVIGAGARGGRKKGDELMGAGYRISKGEKVVCATRCAHLDEDRWDEAEVWDGRRFFDVEGIGKAEEDGTGVKKQRAREIHGFGGGISICEGRHLATSELKAFLALTLSSFDISLVPLSPSTSSYDLSSLPSLAIKNTKDAFRPKILPGRVGLGLLQFEDSGVKLRFRKRVGGAGIEHL